MIARHKAKLFNFLIIFSFIILSILSCAILFSTHTIFGGQDLGFHFRRIYELRECIEHGQFFPMYSFNQYHGLAIMALYPYITLYPIILLSFLISSKITLVYVSFACYELFSLLVSYYSSYSWNQSKKISYLFSVIYSMSTMLLYDQFSVMDMGMTLSFIFFPLVVFGTFNLLKNNKWVELSLGLTFIIFSHVPSIMIAMGFLVVMFLAYIKCLNKRILFSSSKMLGLTASLTSIVWVPVLKFLPYFIHSAMFTPAHTSTNTYGLSLFDFGKNFLSAQPVQFFIGLVPCLAFFITIFFYRKFNFDNKVMFYLSILIMLLCSKLFPWSKTTHGILRVLGFIQIPGRFYILPQIMMIYLLSVVVVKYINSQKISETSMILLLVIAVGFQIVGQFKVINQGINRSVISNNYFNNHVRCLSYKKLPVQNILPKYRITKSNQIKHIINPGITYIIDYYPKNALPMAKQVNFNKGVYDGHHVLNVNHVGYNRFSFNGPKKINRLSLPLLHYNGEHLRVYVNHRLVHYRVNKNSLITLSNVKKGRNVVGVKSISSHILVWIKIILFSIGILWIIYLYMKNKNLYKWIIKFCEKDPENKNNHRYLNGHYYIRNSIVLISFLLSPVLTVVCWGLLLLNYLTKYACLLKLINGIATCVFLLEIPIFIKINAMEGNHHAKYIEKISTYISMILLALNTYADNATVYIYIPRYISITFQGLSMLVLFIYNIYVYSGTKKINNNIIHYNIHNPYILIRRNSYNNYDKQIKILNKNNKQLQSNEKYIIKLNKLKYVNHYNIALEKAYYNTIKLPKVYNNIYNYAKRQANITYNNLIGTYKHIENDKNCHDMKNLYFNRCKIIKLEKGIIGC